MLSLLGHEPEIVEVCPVVQDPYGFLTYLNDCSGSGGVTMIILAQASLMNGHCIGACVCVRALENQKVVSVIGRHPWYKRTGRR